MSTGSGDGPSYDFFIAHAGPDVGDAEQLFDLLAGEAAVFLDSRCLQLGDDFDHALAAAQARSAVTVVLVSDRTGKAFYQREEIAAAIAMARSEQQHRVVPVYLTPRRELADAIPYGLRLKHGVEVSDTVTLAVVAQELLKLRDRLAGAAEPGGGSAAAGTPDLDAVFSRDPTIALPAVDAIVASGSLPAADVVARLRGLNRVQVFVLRRLLAAFPAESGPPMVERILAADASWDGAVHVPSCLTPAHAPHCVEPLVQGLEAWAPDVVRLSIEGLGYLGAQQWGWRIDKLVQDASEYEYGKYATYAVEARARMLVQFEPGGFDPGSAMTQAFTSLEQLVRTIEGRGAPASTEVPEILARCRPAHADGLLRWLDEDLPRLRELAASALGSLGLRRTVPHLLARARDGGEEAGVREQALGAVGAIGGPDAAAGLAAMLDDAELAAPLRQRLRVSLARCLADLADEDDFARLAPLLLGDPWADWLVYRAIGLRGDARFEDRLRQGLEAVDSAPRSAAGLALARVIGPPAAPGLRRAYEEAVTPLERVVLALALLLLGEAPPSDPDLGRLCADLARDSYAYDRVIRADIVDVLAGTDHPRAKAVGAAWAPIYAEGHTA